MTPALSQSDLMRDWACGFFNSPEASDRAAGIAKLATWAHVRRDARQARDGELLELAKTVWHEVTGARSWPGWSVQFADLRKRGALGMCLPASKRVLIDAPAHSSGPELIRSLVHEFVHLELQHDRHDTIFRETEQRWVDRVLPEAGRVALRIPAPPRPVPSTGRPGRHPEPVRGRLWAGRGGWISKPGLDPTLEYR